MTDWQAGNTDRERFAQRIRARMPGLAPGLRRVAAFIEQNLSAVPNLSALDLGAQAGVSDATVIRACRALGFDGLPGLRRAIAEVSGDRSTQAGMLRAALRHVNVDAEKAVSLVLDHEGQLIANLKRQPASVAMNLAVARLHPARRIVVFGTGASGHLAGYMATMLARHGRPALVLDASGFSLADQMLGIGEGDAILMLFFGRPYGEAEAVMQLARGLNLPLVMITENRHNPLVGHDDVVIEVRRVGGPGTPIHGAVFICLEALLMGLAAIDDSRALAMLETLAANRERIATATRRITKRTANP